MKFGAVPNPQDIDFSLPEDHQDTSSVLGRNTEGFGKVYVGCAKWNKQDLKGFYPRGTKDELTYYGTQFNCIELNLLPHISQSAIQEMGFENTRRF